ncbi:MAG: hypothetical protein QUS11_06480 [Candidatus Fermentibacter sp.]|nr:hypothetical protein [Candidatus Fermentibacter sp.]
MDNDRLGPPPAGARLDERIVDQALEAALGDPAFRAGYEAVRLWQAASTLDGLVEPANPYFAGSDDALRWDLGAEQADLEAGSPSSWRDGGGGSLGVLRALEGDMMFEVSVRLRERTLDPDHCPSVSPSGSQRRRERGHPTSLCHYARGGTWRSDYAERRRVRGFRVVEDPALPGAFMRAANPFLGRMEP